MIDARCQLFKGFKKKIEGGREGQEICIDYIMCNVDITRPCDLNKSSVIVSSLS